MTDPVAEVSGAEAAAVEPQPPPDVELDVRALRATQFQRTFRQVYARRSAAVLLVYAPQGSGKSLFCMRLLQDYRSTSERSDRGGCTPNLKDNLWHVLVATGDPDETKIREATANTTLEKVDDQNASWLPDLRTAARPQPGSSRRAGRERPPEATASRRGSSGRRRLAGAARSGGPRGRGSPVYC